MPRSPVIQRTGDPHLLCRPRITDSFQEAMAWDQVRLPSGYSSTWTRMPPTPTMRRRKKSPIATVFYEKMTNHKIFLLERACSKCKPRCPPGHIFSLSSLRTPTCKQCVVVHQEMKDPRLVVTLSLIIWSCVWGVWYARLYRKNRVRLELKVIQVPYTHTHALDTTCIVNFQVWVKEWGKRALRLGRVIAYASVIVTAIQVSSHIYPQGSIRNALFRGACR